MFSDTYCINDMLTVRSDPESLKCTPFILSEKYYYYSFVDFQYQAWHGGVNIPDRKYYTFKCEINTIENGNTIVSYMDYDESLSEHAYTNTYWILIKCLYQTIWILT